MTLFAIVSAISSWNWDAKTVDHDPHEIWVDFEAGDYSVEFSGRSTRFKVDRWSLALQGVNGTNDALPESTRT